MSEPTKQQIAKARADLKATLAAMTPEARAANKASEAVCNYVEALAAGEIAHDPEKFGRLMARNYKAVLTNGTEIGGRAVTRLVFGKPPGTRRAA